MQSNNNQNIKNNKKCKSIHWNTLKKIIFSENKLTFLNKIRCKDLCLFDKEITEEYYIYKSINNIYLNELNKNNTNINNFSFNCSFKFYRPLANIKNNLKEESLKDYNNQKIDNTGNIEIWPCEELLALYCLNKISMFEGKDVIELGAGFSGLASFLIAKNINVKSIVITDGNSKCVEYIDKSINLNFNNVFNNNSALNAVCFDWSNKDFELYKSNKLFDFIIISDCLFFTKYHNDLIFSIRSLLKVNGECIIISPKRGSTMDDFLEKINQSNLFNDINSVLLVKSITSVNQLKLFKSSSISESINSNINLNSYNSYLILISKVNKYKQ